MKTGYTASLEYSIRYGDDGGVGVRMQYQSEYSSLDTAYVGSLSTPVERITKMQCQDTWHGNYYTTDSWHLYTGFTWSN